MTTPEITVSQEDLDALMAELESELAATGGVPAPVVVESKLEAPVESASDEVKDLAAAAIEAMRAGEVKGDPVVEAPRIKRAYKKRTDLEAPVVSADSIAPAVEAPTTSDSAFSPEELAEDPVAASAKATSDLNFYVDVTQFKADTAVSDTTLDKCMIEQSGQRAYYGAQAAHAKAQHARVSAMFDVLEAQLGNGHRKRLAALGEKVTEKMVETAVILDPRWIDAKNRVIDAGTIYDVNKALVDSLSDRKDMLVQLGADRRQEAPGSMRMVSSTPGAGKLSTVNDDIERAQTSVKAVFESRTKSA